ncbi:hypothetical protein GLYMA_13G257051v4 [Glycine max]|nr:hypothetical protein GYH30_037377 [Glycine max]KRH21603.2 hypothetical protein GLYMA_13G257051v4 [Glycine max]
MLCKLLCCLDLFVTRWINSVEVFYRGIQPMKGVIIGSVGKEFVHQRRLEVWDYDRLVMLMMSLR